MAFKDQYLLTQNEEFKQRVAMAVQTCALQILKEPVDTSTRTGKARWGSASTVVGSGVLDSRPYVTALAADPSIGVDSSDEELLGAVLALWDLMTGVR